MLAVIQKKIVIVEDDLILQELHMHYATNLGHEVIACFQDGISAAEFFKENSADLILMDISLEGDLDGVQTAALIQQTQNIPIKKSSSKFDIFFISCHSSSPNFSHTKS